MADYSGFQPGGHPTFGSKSFDNLPANPYAAPPAEDAPEREQPYKSWRKKYRKMRATFDGVLEENKRLFKEEQKLESLSKRLKEELDGLLDICLDLNENPSLPPDLRYNIRTPPRHPPVIDIPPDITPEQANRTVMEYKAAVQQGSIPALDLQIIRKEVEQVLAAQDSQPLDDLIASIPSRPVAGPGTLPDDIRGDDPSASYSADQEAEHLLRLDARLGDPLTLFRASDGKSLLDEDKHLAEMTPRELERHLELLNPQSQHNWLKRHHKLGSTTAATAIAGDVDDNEALASHEPKPPRKRGGNKNLAKQVGDRAVERAREGWSPGAASVAANVEEEELSDRAGRGVGVSGSGRKPGPREGDIAYHPKGGKKGKRKRSGEEIGGTAGGKKPRTDGGGGSVGGSAAAAAPPE